MEHLPPDLSPATISEWIKAGPWVFAIALIILMLKRDLLGLLFPARSYGGGDDHAKVIIEAHREALEAAKKSNELLRDLLSVQRTILNEVLRGSDRAG
jgi:hypothetical protein